MAPGLNLPPPTADGNAKHATVEDVQEASMGSAPTASTHPAKTNANRFATGGIIYPPPEIRNIIEKTASFIARLGKQFEERMKSEDKAGKLSFLSEDDPYHAFYEHTLQNGSTTEADGSLQAADGEDAGGADVQPTKEEDTMPEPESYLFSAELPSTTAMDLDILKLTALFTAARGRSFASETLAREGKTFQFEFLRPSHSLFPFFNRLTEQYRLVIEAPEEIRSTLSITTRGEPSAVTLDAKQGAGVGGLRKHLLDKAHERAEWERKIRDSRRKKEDEEAGMRAAFDEIDWQDFVVAQTVEITETDMHIDLPLPMSIRDIQSMTLAQKKLASMIMDPEASDTGVGAGAGEEDAMDMESDDEQAATAALQQTEQVIKASTGGDMKVRKNYVPRALLQKQQAEATTTCPVCGQQVPLREMDEHVRIELLNPQFRDQRRDLEAKQAQHKALQSGADPVSALRQYAGARTDIFGAEAEERARTQREEEERRLARDKERFIYDGHIASKATTLERAQKVANSDEAVRAREMAQRQAVPAPVIGPQAGGPPQVVSDNLKRPADGPPPGEPNSQRLQVDGNGLGPSPRFDSPVANPPPTTEQQPNPSAMEISISVQLPDNSSVSPVCDGRTISLQPLPATTTMANIRDLIHGEILQAAVGASRIKLKVNGKATTLKQTLAHWNLHDGSMVELSIK